MTPANLSTDRDHWRATELHDRQSASGFLEKERSTTFVAYQSVRRLPTPKIQADLSTITGLLALEGRKVVEPPGDTVLTTGRIEDSDPCALFHTADTCQSDPEPISKLVGPGPGHIRR